MFCENAIWLIALIITIVGFIGLAIVTFDSRSSRNNWVPPRPMPPAPKPKDKQ